MVTDSRDSCRIVVVQESLRDNGGVRVMLDLLARWAESDGRADLFCLLTTDLGERLAPVPEGVITYWGTRRPGRFRYLWVVALARLAWLCRRKDVVVSGSEIGYSVLLGYCAARLTRRPFVVVVHADAAEAIRTWVPRPLRGLNQRALKNADVLVCVSRGIARGLARNFAVPEQRLVVIPNSVDSERVRRLADAAPRTASGLDPDVPVVLSVGRLAPEKGQEVLIRASGELMRRGVPHRVVMLGEGEHRAELEKLIAELGLSGTVELHGFEANPYGRMASADLVCLPSRREGMPLVLLEALALGVPVVATDCGDGCRELLADGRFGALVPVDQPKALAEAIERHIADPQVLRERASVAVQALQGQDAGVTAERYQRAFSDLAGRSRRLPKTV